MGLSSHSHNMFIVLRKNKKLDTSTLKQYLELNCSSWAFIEHYSDIKEDGSIEGCHYHICAIYFSEKRIKTVLNELVDLYHFKNGDGIEIQVMSNLYGAMQYLTHQNYPLKQQHNRSEIVTNYSSEELDDLLTKPPILTAEILYQDIIAYPRLVDLILFLGLPTYQKYRLIIKDIRETVNLKKPIAPSSSLD